MAVPRRARARSSASTPTPAPSTFVMAFGALLGIAGCYRTRTPRCNNQIAVFDLLVAEEGVEQDNPIENTSLVDFLESQKRQ